MSVVYCKACGAQVWPNLKFCVECGAPAPFSIATQGENAAAQAPEVPPVAPSGRLNIPAFVEDEIVLADPNTGVAVNIEKDAAIAMAQTALPPQFKTVDAQPAQPVLEAPETPTETSTADDVQEIPPQEFYDVKELEIETVEATKTKYSPLGIWGNIGNIVLLAIPVVGFIMALVWTFLSGINVNRRNYAKAMLIVQLFAIALCLIIVALAATVLKDFLFTRTYFFEVLKVFGFPLLDWVS